MPATVQTRIAEAPLPGEVLEVAPGVLWTRMPLAEVPDHVNLYVLDDGPGWTLVDTGKHTPACNAALDRLLGGPLAGKPVTRVLVTHFHPDHIGQLGRLARAGAEVWATRDTWFHARMTQLEPLSQPTPEHLAWVTRGGMKGLAYEAYKRRPPGDYPQVVQAIPLGYRRLIDGEEITVGARRWRVVFGHGHAPQHATFWSDDGLAIVGDQVLPGMSADVSVLPAEPEADPLQEWFDSCRRMATVATDDTLCLAGHNHPYTGVPLRCEQLVAVHEAVLSRLRMALQRPQTAVDCLDMIHGRRMSPAECGERLGEAVSYLNHLRRQGQVDRLLDRSGAYVWRRV